MFLSALFAIIPLIHSAQELSEQLPMSESAIEAVSEASLSQFQEGLDHFLSIPEENRTFDNTIRAWDFLEGNLDQTLSCLDALLNIHPDKSVREYLEKTIQKMNQIHLDSIAAHPEIYRVCQSIQHTARTEVERYYAKELLLSFERQGMQLSDEKRALYAKTVQEIDDLCMLFSRHVAEDASALFATKEELTGLDPAWIDGKNQKEPGVYRLPCDFPTYQTVMAQCSNKQVRKAMYELYNNRAYPQNEEVVKELIAKRDALAKLLGYSSYASYRFSNQMAGSVDNVKTFLSQVKKKASIRSEHEFKHITEKLPEGVVLTSAGQLETFDEIFAMEEYKKKRFSVNQEKVAEYFTLEKSLQGLLQIYSQFFHLSIQEATHSFPIPDLKTLEIRDGSHQLLGVVLLDLFPREGKSSHSGLCSPIIPAFSPPNGPQYTASCLVVCNMAKPTKDRPALLTHLQLSTLFHEFGHAIHHILARNAFLSFCGLHVKRDFVELPSMLLENWLLDPGILKQVSSHYVTGEPLPDDLIDNVIQAKRFGIGNFVEWIRARAELSLAFFDAGENENPTALMQQILARERPHIFLGPTNHFYASWWHIPTYGPNFYSYLWSQVFALDLFDKIQKEGLLNPESGMAYANAILSKGGSRDPNLMLRDYLEREPSFEPFFKRLSVE
jgi:thimet oligopeptidase